MCGGVGGLAGMGMVAPIRAEETDSAPRGHGHPLGKDSVQIPRVGGWMGWGGGGLGWTHGGPELGPAPPPAPPDPAGTRCCASSPPATRSCRRCRSCRTSRSCRYRVQRQGWLLGRHPPPTLPQLVSLALHPPNHAVE